ncbi:MAG: polysaccharide pyruvyl transferase family protein [Desulfobulbaceae bacterium]|nr:polysaccharide pyruvyl transferase family protein [Desulfobulbaceae bacterium]
MKILICGADFENKGAEAMLRTVQVELASRLQAVEFFLWRPAVFNHNITLSSGITPILLPYEEEKNKFIYLILGWRIARAIWTIKEILKRGSIISLITKGNRFTAACNYYLERTMGRVDALIDISGFAYGDVPWADGSIQSIKPLITLCQRQDKPVFFLPQAWGPFLNSSIRNGVKEILKGETVKFYSRDTVSSQHLETLLEEGPILSHQDIVFNFKGGTSKQGKQILYKMGCSITRPIIGISPNMRVFERSSGIGSSNQYIKIITRLIRHCLDKYDVDIVLQASEIKRYGATKDDRYICSLIANVINQPDRCFMTRDFLTAEETKAIICQFTYIIGSRFHSLVFALSNGIPGMPISWTHKYRELYSLFGLQHMVQECDKLDLEDIIIKFDRAWVEQHQHKKIIKKQLVSIQKKNDAIFNELADMIVKKRK